MVIVVVVAVVVIVLIAIVVIVIVVLELYSSRYGGVVGISGMTSSSSCSNSGIGRGAVVRHVDSFRSLSFVLSIT